jgi:iron(II)-dependent oxidoreductase
MAWVPSGYFTMGMDQDVADRVAKAFGARDWEEPWAWEWFPSRKVFVPGYFIDQCEVTRDQWEQYAAATGAKPVKGIAKGPQEPQHGDFGLYPATTIFWSEAQQYANWAGKQLPTDAQWEKAARGTDGRIFPWGNDMPTPELGVFVDIARKQTTMIQPVGSHPKGASPYGCLDMAGNVWEWTSSLYRPLPYRPGDGREDPASAEARVLRGGAWRLCDRKALRCANRYRSQPLYRYTIAGFRCAQDAR